MAHVTKDPEKPVCEICGRRVEFLNGSRYVSHLATVAGKEADADHAAVMAPMRGEW